MTESAERQIHAVLIPWVIALVALIGLNAIGADHSRPRKSNFPGESGLSQPADTPLVPGHAAGQQLFLIPASAPGAVVPLSRMICIGTFRAEPSLESPKGLVRGRAPPAGMLA